MDNMPREKVIKKFQELQYLLGDDTVTESHTMNSEDLFWNGRRLLKDKNLQKNVSHIKIYEYIF